MMTQPAKAPRFFSMAAFFLMVILIGLTFTAAAEKDEASARNQRVDTPPSPGQRAQVVQRAIQVLEQEWAKTDDQVKRKQAELNRLRKELGVNPNESRGYESDPSIDPETWRWITRDMIEQGQTYEQLKALYDRLRALDRTELAKVLPTAFPDVGLSTLFQSQASYQQQLVLKQAQYSAGHPEVKALEKVLEKIQQQVEERMDGILMGLKMKVETQKTALDKMEIHLAESKQKDVERSILLQPYFRTKRDLENLMMIRERLQLRIQQEKVDAALPRSE